MRKRRADAHALRMHCVRNPWNAGTMFCEAFGVRCTLASLLLQLTHNYLCQFGRPKIESAGLIIGGVCLQLAITGAACATETLAGSTSHDPDDNCRHAALRRFWVGDWNFFWVHTALSAEDLAIDRYGVGLSLQQDCGCDCGNPARRGDLGNARDLSCRISIGMLEFAAAAGAACSFSPVWTARLRALACIFTGRLAHILAGVCRLHVPRGSFGDHYLFCDAVAGESGSNITEGRMRGVEQSPRRLLNALAKMRL